MLCAASLEERNVIYLVCAINKALCMAKMQLFSLAPVVVLHTLTNLLAPLKIFR